MSREQFSKASELIEVRNEDVKGVASTVKSTSAYSDVLSGLSIAIVTLFVVLFLTGFFTDKVARYFHGAMGYSVIIVIFIIATQSIYNEILKSFDNVCGKSFIVEGENRFYVIISMAYYYVKTWIKTILNMGIIYIIVYIIFFCIRANLEVPQRKTFENFDSYQPIMKILAFFYIIIGLIITFQLELYIFYTIIAGNAKRAPVSLVSIKGLLIGLLVFGYAVIFWMEATAGFWMFLMRNKPNLDLFSHDKLFMVLGMKKPSDFVFKFFYGLIICICLAFFVVPRFDPNLYCKIVKGSFDEEELQEQKNKHAIFKRKFVFSFFVTMTVVIAIFIFDMVLLTLK